jgi:hypothetical protein
MIWVPVAMPLRVIRVDFDISQHVRYPARLRLGSQLRPPLK